MKIFEKFYFCSQTLARLSAPDHTAIRNEILRLPLRQAQGSLRTFAALQPAHLID